MHPIPPLPALRRRFALLLAVIVGVLIATLPVRAAQPLYRVAGKTTAPVAAAAKGGGWVGRVTKLERASLGSLATLRAGMQVNLPLSDSEAVEGTVNLVKIENGYTRSGGSLNDGTKGTFYLSTDGTEINGFILRPNLQKAYRFETAPDGSVVLKEVLLNDVLCGYLPPIEEPAPARASTNNPVAIIPPILNSRPDAVAQLYLDFDGEVVNDPLWNGGKTINALPANVTTQELIDVFNRVKEDFLPFNINVTTDPARYDRAALGKRMRCIITPTNDAAPNAGGVAYLRSFAEAGRGPFSSNIPCWVFNGPVVGMAEAVSHELGHTFGLSHDGQETPDGHVEYYIPRTPGPTGWGPIMGAGYYVAVTQWSKGEYQYANNQEDDVAIISNAANSFGYVTDEAGGTLGTAARLGNDRNGPLQTGIISRASDVDVYSFATTGGDISLKATLAPVPNLDIALELVDPVGKIIATARPPAALAATLIATVPQGTYYLRIYGDGAANPVLGGYSNYASIGGYTITGTVPGIGTTLSSNLAFIKPSGFGDRLVVATEPGTTSDSPIYYAEDTLYLDFTVGNVGFAPTSGGFDTAVYIDDVLQTPLVTTAEPLPNGGSNTTLDYAVGPLPEGQHVIRVQADNGNAIAETDESDNGYTRTINVTVPGPPTITSINTASGKVGESFAYSIKATNIPSSYSAEGLPPGLSIKQGTSFITGTPTAPGTFDATITASNGLGSDSATLTIAVLPATPVINAPDTVTGVAGSAFTYQIQATSEPTGYAANGLPPGLIVNPETGLISGVPTAAGEYVVTFNAFNTGGTGTTTVIFRILLGAPAITSASVANGRVNQPFSFQITAINSPTSYGAAGLPAGLSINPATGLISGSPDAAGTFNVTVSATNENQTTSAALRLVIATPVPVVAWGAPGPATVPADRVEDSVAVAAGLFHSLALHGDGTVVVWGSNEQGQLNVPEELSGVIAIAAGDSHSLALRRDGTVAAWGSNTQEQTDVPAGLTSATAVAAGTAHSLALRADGTVVGWGDDSSNQATPPASVKNAVGIAAGRSHSVALLANGTAVAWGDNTGGQLNIPATLNGLKQVAAGDGFTVALRQTGTVVVVGNNNAGQLLPPAGLSGVVSVAAGGKHILALRADGTAVAWGTNSLGESMPPKDLRNVAALSAGTVHSVALVQSGAPRAIAVAPVNAPAPVGGTITLLAYGVGTGPLGYQWILNGADLPGQTSPFLRLENLQPATANGVYTFRLTNAAGNVVSPEATLTLTEPLSEITVVASRKDVEVGGDDAGVLSLTRTGDISKELVVNYSVKGSADNGVDYTRLKGIKKMKAGKASVKIKVKPLGDLGGANKKVVKFTLLPGDGYTVGTTAPVKVRILAQTR